MIEISFALNRQQSELLNIRTKRQLYRLCSEEKLHSLIKSAVHESELVAIIKKYGLSDVCDFTGLHISVAKKLTDCIVTVLYRYPRLRSRVCFIGSYKGYEKAIKRLVAADGEFLKMLGVQHILTSANARQFGEAVNALLGEIQELDGENILAQAISFCGIFDAIIIDERDFGARDIRQIKIELESSVLASHFPKGCASIESVIYHEIGHLLDFLCNASSDSRLRSEYDGLSRDSIVNNLSYYASTSVAEFIAEGFSEYMSSESPRALANRIVQLLDERYKTLD